MPNTAGFIILAAICLSVAARPYLTTFRRKAWGFALYGSSCGVLLGMHSAADLADPSFENQAKVVAFSMAINAIMVVLMFLTMWFADRRRMT